MKQKMTVIILSFTLAMFLISGGFSAWKDRLQIDVSLTTAAAKEEAEDALSHKPTPATKPNATTEEPCAETEEPSEVTEEPSEVTEAPAAEVEEPSEVTEEPSEEAQAPAEETGTPSAATEKPSLGLETEVALGNGGSNTDGISE